MLKRVRVVDVTICDSVTREEVIDKCVLFNARKVGRRGLQNAVFVATKQL